MKWRHVWAATALVAVTSTGTARAEEAQFTLLHDSYLHQTRYKFWQFSGQPQDWTTPVDYSHGTTYVRYEITSILQPAALQFCYFQDSHIPENHACAPEWRFDKPGVYYMKQDMGTIWQRSGIEWTRPLLDFMIIDNLSMGAAKVALTVDIVVVGAGAQLHAPDNWNCPADWPCVGGGGGGGGGGGSGGTGGTSSGGAGGAGGTSSGGAGGTTGGVGGTSSGGSSTGGSMATGGASSGGASSGGSSGASGGGSGGAHSGGSDSGGASADGGSPNDGGSPSDGGSSNSGGSAGAGGTTTKPQEPSTGGTSATGGSETMPDPDDDDGEVKSHSLDTGDDSGCAWTPTPMAGGSTAWATLFGVLGWAAVRRRTRR